MALLAFGTLEARRAHVAVMRMVATAGGSRTFEGPDAELVRKFAALIGCPGCHGFEQPLDFRDLLGTEPPWSNDDEAIAALEALLPEQADRIEAVHAGLLVALFADSPDEAGLAEARRIASALGCDRSLIDNIIEIASAGAVTAKADLFRRFLAERIDVEEETIRSHMERHDLATITRPATIEDYHRLVAEAPEGSLGAQMRKFYDDARFDIPGTPGTPLPVEFLGSHDVHHVLAGYDTSAQGEAYTAVFNAGNSSAGIGWLTVVLLQWHQGIKLGVFPEGHSHLDPAMMATAAERGSMTTTDLYDAHWDWMALLDQPIDQVRAALSVTPGGQVEDGGCWAP